MSLREKWSFTFTREALLKAARIKAKYHREHEADWAKKHSRWDTEMGQTAKVEEVPITGGKQRILRYDTGLQTKVNEALNRRDAHKRDAEGFERWIRALMNTDKDVTFTLDVDDVAYFGL